MKSVLFPGCQLIVFGLFAQLFVREEHRCKSFKWFMEEIAYDIPLHYPLPPKNVEWGEVSTHTACSITGS